MPCLPWDIENNICAPGKGLVSVKQVSLFLSKKTGFKSGPKYRGIAGRELESHEETEAEAKWAYSDWGTLASLTLRLVRSGSGTKDLM
jgi:hypothetical protein